MRLALFLLLGVLCFQQPVFGFEFSEHNPEFAKEYDIQCAMGAERDVFSQSKCVRATSRQKKVVARGIEKKNRLLARCLEQAGESDWCSQIIRPNPASSARFRCTYGSEMPHFLVHPDELTWDFPIEAVRIVSELEEKDIKVCQIYNWWRPEPYNKNVGGSPTRHPFGTSVDVRFCSKSDQDQAFLELCKLKKQGRIRAIGYYSSPSIHFGVGDRRGNTWGRSCPSE